MNETLRSELEEMHTADQSTRVRAMAIAREHGRSSPEYDEIRERGQALDRTHVERLLGIVQEFGWPGVDLVGELGSEGALLVLQHADLATQKRLLPLVREAAASGAIGGSALPLLEDRVRVRDGERQLYGTQVSRNADGLVEPLPIEDAARVDERRARVGLEPLADYLQRFETPPSPAGGSRPAE